MGSGTVWVGGGMGVGFVVGRVEEEEEEEGGLDIVEDDGGWLGGGGCAHWRCVGGQ